MTKTGAYDEAVMSQIVHEKRVGEIFFSHP